MNPKPQKIPRSVYVRYILMNVPGLAGFILVLFIVQRWFVLPGWLFWLLIVCWIAKDVVLFPLVWRAYEPNVVSLTGNLVGEYGLVKKRLAPSGYVQVRGELWKAEQAANRLPLEVGSLVRIYKMEGLTLYVEPNDAEET